MIGRYAHMSLWFIPMAFFVVAILVLTPRLLPGAPAWQYAVPMVFLVGITALAWWVSEKHYPGVKKRVSSPVMLAFVPLSYVYVIFIELSAVISDVLGGAGLEEYFFLLFGYWYLFLPIFIAAWIIFRKVPIGKWTFLAAYLLGVAFELVQNDSIGFSLLSGFLWIWFLHSGWFLTSLLIRPKR